MSKLPSKIPRILLFFIYQACFLSTLSVKATKCPEILVSSGSILCYDPPLVISPTPASSSSPAYFTAQTSVLTFHFRSLIGDCLATGIFDLFIISIGATERQIYRLFWDGSSLTVGSEVAHGERMAALSMSRPLSQGLDNFFDVIISINLATGKVTNIISATQQLLYNSDFFRFQSTWRFDSSTKLYVGSSPGGASTAQTSFDYMELRVYPKYFDSKKEMQRLLFTTLGVNLLRRYEMDVIGAPDLSDISGDPNKRAEFGPNPDSPSWIGGGSPGLEFTPNQYIELVVPLGDVLEVLEFFPMTFSFWFRYETLPSTNGYILQGVNQYTSLTFITLELLTDGNLRASFPSYLTGTTTTPVPLATWTLITVSYLGIIEITSIAIYYGPTMVGIWDNNALVPSAPLSSFHIGGPNGFTGKISGFSIYQEGAFLVTESCEGSVPFCNLQLGPDNSFCLNYNCDSNCIQCTPDGCLCSLPNRLDDGVCTCGAPDATYFDGTNCHLCPDHCTTCSDAATCLSCEAGFGLSNGLCVSCTSGVVFDDNSCRRDLEKLYDNVRLENLRGISSPIVDSIRLIMEGKGASISVGLILDMVSNIKYFNISYSPKLQEILNSWNPDSDPILLQIPMSESMQDNFPQEPLPYPFARYFQPSSFLVNFWSCFISVLILVGLVISVRTLEAILLSLSKEGTIYLAIRRLRYFLQNYLIAQAYSVFGEIICYSCLGFRTATFPNAAAGFSFVISIICIIIVFSVFYFHFSVIRKYQNIKKNQKAESLQEWKEQNAGNKFFFDDLKDEKIIQQSYLLILVVREFIFYLMLTVLPSHPIAQTIVNIVINLLIFSYLIIIRPFERIIDAVHQLSFEFALLNINVCLIINALLDESSTLAISVVGYYIIVVNIIMNVLILILLPIQGFFNLREQYHLYKEWKSKRKIAPVPTVSTPNSFMMSNFTHSPDSQIGLNLAKPKKLIRKITPEEQSADQGNLEETPFTFKSTTLNNQTQMTMISRKDKEKENVFFLDEDTAPIRDGAKKSRHKIVFETDF